MTPFTRHIREFGNQQRQRQKLKITSGVCVCQLKHIIQPVIVLQKYPFFFYLRLRDNTLRIHIKHSARLRLALSTSRENIANSVAF